MRKIRSHVEEWFKDIPDSEAKEAMKDEIVQNLEEKVQDLIRKGKAEEDAINKAIVDFGDIADIKEELGGGQAARNARNRYGIHLGFSIWGSVLIIGLMIFINFYTSPDTIWFVYPTFGVLWWPLTMFYRWLANKQ